MSDTTINTIATTTNENNTTAYPITRGKVSALDVPANGWLISQDFRKPEKLTLSAIIPQASQGDMSNVPEQYRGLLATVMENAAKTILKRYVESFSIYPSSIPCSLLDADSIMSEAVGNNSEWLNKDELTQAWEASATRAKFTGDPRFAGNGMVREYRAAVMAYAELILKLAGKTSTYQPEELDTMLAKLHTDDFDTPLGNFITRRVEMLRNKKAAPAVNLDLL